MAENTSVMKELHGLFRKASKLYDGQVEFCTDGEEDINQREGEDSYLDVVFFVTPNDGLYKNARVKFVMRIDTLLYPNSAPEMYCHHSIYHPNINYYNNDCDYGADICVNLLGSDWEPEVGLDGSVMAVLFLFYNPQIDDALSPVCTGIEDSDAFEENVRISLRGEEVDGYTFDKLIHETDEDNSDLNNVENTPVPNKDNGSDTAGALTENEKSDNVTLTIATEIVPVDNVTNLTTNENGQAQNVTNTMTNDNEQAENVTNTMTNETEQADNCTHITRNDNEQSNNVANTTTNENEQSDVNNAATNENEEPDDVISTTTNENGYSNNVLNAVTDINDETENSTNTENNSSIPTAAVDANTCPLLQRQHSRQKQSKLFVFNIWYLKLKDRLSFLFAPYKLKS